MNKRATAFLGTACCSLGAYQLAFFAPANAQYMPAITAQAYQDVEKRENCLQGEPLPENELHEADAPAIKIMQGYWAAASSQDMAKIADLYRALGKAEWVSQGIVAKARSVGITDPFARKAGNLLIDTPVALIRGGSGHDAEGVWEVKDGAGSHVGYYYAHFVRSPNWRLTRLELIASDAPAPKIGPFCTKQGDIEAFSAAENERGAKRAARRAAREAR